MTTSSKTKRPQATTRLPDLGNMTMDELRAEYAGYGHDLDADLALLKARQPRRRPPERCVIFVGGLSGPALLAANLISSQSEPPLTWMAAPDLCSLGLALRGRSSTDTVVVGLEQDGDQQARRLLELARAMPAAPPTLYVGLPGAYNELAPLIGLCPGAPSPQLKVLFIDTEGPPTVLGAALRAAAPGALLPASKARDADLTSYDIVVCLDQELSADALRERAPGAILIAVTEPAALHAGWANLIRSLPALAPWKTQGGLA